MQISPKNNSHVIDSYLHKQHLKKQEIIRGYLVFQNIIKNGTKVTGKYVTFFYVDNVVRRVGFTVSRQYKKAVHRNRIKRLMKEVYRKNKSIFPVGDIILFGKYVDTKPTYQTMYADITELIKNFNA